MSRYSVYKIPLNTLSVGKHEFSYDLDNKFFELIDDGTADVKKGVLKVLLSLKVSTLTTFELVFIIEGSVNVPCDRCLDDITMPVATKNRLIVKFGTEYTEESDEILIIPEEDGEINIAWFLYEFIMLSLPAKRVHPSGECNKAMSSKLSKHRVSSVGDDMSEEDDDEDEVDTPNSTNSKWDTLSNLDKED